ncbi:uncharacterized protein LOC131025764 [Salvia miltiorrhiza]|uniref:uncharacterized protein LOC131025764 n=1 Tax=Salvia miltiorrhiza TaxID=226208 RepID=UPI0025ACB3FE|nr:uncharacterized protein LOC131025764 [Salvia miltiorrhiza]
MGTWEETEWIWDLKWRRTLFDWEVPILNELLSSISAIVPTAGTIDGWRWTASKDGRFSTSSAYAWIKESRSREVTRSSSKQKSALAWKICAPQKVRVSAWRILRNRLPSCDNLRKRNIPVGEEEIMCNACCQEVESANHVFLTCPKTDMLWSEIQRWTGFLSARPNSIEGHFDVFTQMGKGKKSRRFLSALWACTTWLIWKGRNESRFEGKNWDVKKLCGEIKARMWSWNRIFNFF